MRIALLIADCGDGSNTIRWFKDVRLAERLCSGSDALEEFYSNEGSPTYIEVPDDWAPPFGYDDDGYEEYIGNSDDDF